MTRAAVEIAALYKARWAIELLFRWLKQHLNIRKFVGKNENAICVSPSWSAASFFRGDPRLLLTRPSCMRRALKASWRSGYAEDCKSLYGGSIPSEASRFLAV